MLEPGDSRGMSFRVLSWDKASYTVSYGHREVHIHPSIRRRLSILEAMRLQGFPDSYELNGTFSQQVQLVSDALPPPLGYLTFGSALRGGASHKEQRQCKLTTALQVEDDARFSPCRTTLRSSVGRAALAHVGISGVLVIN